jgi:glycosyltransferase involved in cell wall biosynthesis
VRVCYFGRYDPTYSRNVIITKCLERAGAEVVHVRDDRSLPFRTPVLLWRALRARFDVIIVGFRAHSDVFLARLLASGRRVPLIFDPLTSRYEEKVIDRQLVRPDSWLARWYWFSADDDVMRPSASAGTSASQGAFTVFFYGRFSPLHGIEHIVRAAALLEARRNPVRFILVGAGQTQPMVRELAEGLGVSTVEFVDPVPYQTLARMMSDADICLGSFGTTARAQRVIPYKVFDALAVGRAIITADTPAVREALTHGEHAWLCPPGDAEKLAEAIAALKGDPSLRQSLGARGHQLFVERFSLEAMTRDCAAIVGELVRDRRAYTLSR